MYAIEKYDGSPNINLDCMKYVYKGFTGKYYILTMLADTVDLPIMLYIYQRLLKFYQIHLTANVALSRLNIICCPLHDSSMDMRQ